MRVSIGMMATEGAAGAANAVDGKERVSIGAIPEWVEKAVVRDFGRRSGAPVTCLLRDSRIHVPSRTIYTRTVTRLEGSQAVQQLSRVELPFDPHTRSLVIHSIAIFRNGTLKNMAELDRIEIIRREQGLESGIVNGEVSALLLLKDVRIGDVLDVEFSTVDGGSLFADDISWIVGLSAGYAVGTWSLVWIDREDRQLHIEGSHADIAYSEAAAGGLVTRTWLGRAIPEHEPEAQLPPDIFPYPVLQLTPFNGWGEIVSRLLAEWDFSAKDWAALEEELADIRQAAGGDDGRLVDLAVAAARDAVRYQNYSPGLLSVVPENVSVVWERRYGDCKEKSLMLVWLLGELGISAEPVLVASVIGKSLPHLLPAPTLFDHVVVRVTLDGKTLWIDPTDVYRGGHPSAWTYLPFHHALPLAPGSDALIPIPEHPQSYLEVREQVKATRGSPSTAHQVKFTFRGLRADGMRGMADAQGLSGVRRALQGFMESTRPGIEIEGDPVCEDDRTENVVRFEVTAIRPEGIKPHPGINMDHMTIAPFSFVGMLPGVDRIKRTHPLHIGRLDLIEHSIRVEHPDIKVADYPLQSVVNPAFKAKAESFMEKGAPVFKFSLEVRRDRVQPGDLPAYRSDVEKAFGLADVFLQLPKSGRQPISERDPEMAWGHTESSGGQGMISSHHSEKASPIRNVKLRQRRRSHQPVVEHRRKPAIPYWLIGTLVILVIKFILIAANSNW